MLFEWIKNRAKSTPQKAKLKYMCVKSAYRACHFFQLFVTSEGNVFPCCDAAGNDLFKIGHISEVDLVDKIASYEKPCCCHKYRLRKADNNEKPFSLQINVEMSLACQAKCAMCCVNAPEWNGTYDYYERIEDLISKLSPRELFVQGGEVLVQKPSIEWLKGIRKRFPSIMIAVATNGNINEQIQEEIKNLFDRYSISFVGFQPETYSKIMCLDINRTKQFVDNLLSWNNSYVQLKYLVTPINLHETALFLQWALSKSPDRILISDATTESYINLSTKDNYWNKIINRVAFDLKKVLGSSKEHVKANSIVIAMDPAVRKMFELDEDFANSLGLSTSIITHTGWFPQLPKNKMNKNC